MDKTIYSDIFENSSKSVEPISVSKWDYSNSRIKFIWRC